MTNPPTPKAVWLMNDGAGPRMTTEQVQAVVDALNSFTREDVAALEQDAREWEDRSDIFADRATRLRSLATRIKALLPPETAVTPHREVGFTPEDVNELRTVASLFSAIAEEAALRVGLLDRSPHMWQAMAERMTNRADRITALLLLPPKKP